MTDTDVPLDEAPAQRIADAVARFGERDVAERAASLLRGGNEGEEFLLWVGGRHAQGVLDGAPPLYWPEVWGARALLTAWDDSAAPAVIAGLADRAWRVREMCARVCQARGLGEIGQLLPLLVDDNARVRSAGLRVLAERADDQSDALRALLRDPDKEVRRQARQSLARHAERLDEARG